MFVTEWLSTILDLTQENNVITSRIIARNFQSCNKIKEVVNRHVAALSASHLSEVDPLLKDLLQKWERENSGLFGHPFEEAATKAKVEGRAYLRLYFQKTYTSETKKEALEVHCPPKHSVRAYRNNDNTLYRFDYAYYQDGRSLIERQYLRNGLTVIETVEGERVTEQLTLDLGGGFTIVEVNLPQLVTESLKENQNAINSALTLLVNNLLKGGWVQKSVLNAQPPGEWDYDSRGRAKFTPRPEGLPTGMGVVQFIQGLPLKDEKQQITNYTKPEVKIEEPSDPETFLNTVSGFSLSIYEQTSQTFILGSNLVLSGISREQSRFDFANLVRSDSRKFSYYVSDLLTVANYFLGVKQKVVVKILPRIYQGDEHKKLVLEARDRGLVSRRTAIEQLGFTADIEREIEELKLEASQAAALAQPANSTGTANKSPETPQPTNKLSDAPIETGNQSDDRPPDSRGGSLIPV
ncbi:MAG: hypothetical protein DI617_09030 [Streptococcus pyogenes]|nr:MAG: hypothetical protein DI617_09030 [Streptococcus pyogenes]